MVKRCIIYSIPKCGTHFLSQIIALLVNPNCNIYDKDELYKYVIHFTNIQQINRPFFATHPCYLSYEYIKKLPHKKIFIIRNPLDKLISSYFYRVYYRANRIKLMEINKNLNKSIYQYCLKNLKKFCSEIIVHMKMSKSINNSVLFDYTTVLADKKKFIKIIADMIEIPVTDVSIEMICEKTDIKKCSDYEKENNSFKVGAIQNGLFFRQGGTKNYEKYLYPNQIAQLKKQIPQYLHNFYQF